jgi:molybdopterin synthase catalytic subunit
MEVEVRLFAGLRQRAGADRVRVLLPEPATVADLLAAMELPPRSCVVAINREYVAGDRPIEPDDEVALIPPVSGGAELIRLTAEPIDAAELRAAVTDPRAGAVVVFEGVTRTVDALEYEAYAEMAEPVLRRIADEEAARHGLSRVAVAHRVGTVPLSEPSVVIAVSAPHRAEAFAGARAIIDRLKLEVPIFKQEEGEWVAGHLPDGVPEQLGEQRLESERAEDRAE